MCDKVTAPPFTAKLDDIVHQLGCGVRACNPVVVAGPIEDLAVAAAMRPTAGWRAARVQGGVKLADKSFGRGSPIDPLIPGGLGGLGRGPRAVHDDDGFLRFFLSSFLGPLWHLHSLFGSARAIQKIRPP